MPTPAPTRRFFYPTPGWLVILLLAVTGILFISERFRWFPFNSHKGWTVLLAVAGVGVMLGLVLLWWLVALVFRWRYQFSIRTMLVLTVAVALPFSWLAVQLKAAKRQREIAAMILKAGGCVMYDYQTDSSVAQPLKARQNGPAWLRDLVGGDFLDRVTVVDLHGGEDGELEALQGLPDLLGLYTDWRADDPYTSGHVTDSGLACLETLHRLGTLRVWGPNITDAGLAHLERLSRLTDLTVGSRGITDAGLQHLGNLHDLEVLTIEGDRITDAGLTHLQSLRKLKRLWLRDAATRGGTQHLMSQTNLISMMTCRGVLGDALKDKPFRALRSPTKLDCAECPLVDVLDYLQDLHGIKIEINEAALKEAKIPKSREFTYDITGVPLGAFLTSMFDPLGLTWYVGPRGVVITNKAAYAKRHPNLLRLQQALPNLEDVEVDW
jgi:hypothetical protein